MGRILTIVSNKGGVGKTTTALNLSYSYSQFGSKVLLIDGDLQGGIESSTNLRKVAQQGLISCLRGDIEASGLIRFTRNKSFAILGMGAQQPEDAVILEQSAVNGRLGTVIRDLAADFDYVIIDSPAGIGSSVQAFIRSSDGILLVLNCRTLTLKTLPPFLKMVKACQDVHPSVQFDGVLLTQVNRKSIHDMNTVSELRKIFPPEVFLKTTIPLNDLFEQASMKSIPAGLLRDGQTAARPYFNLAMELKERELESAVKEIEDDSEGLF